MKYTVVWTSAAEADLATIWTDADDRTAVTEAANAIDASLQEDPRNQGESRHAGVRVVFSLPLAVEFEIAEQDLSVYVLSVRCARKKRR